MLLKTLQRLLPIFNTMSMKQRYGMLLCSVSVFLMLAVCAHAEEPGYIQSLIEQARQQKLFNDRYWHILLHYKKGLFGVKSLVDDPAFFLAKNGKSDPKAELEATIAAFFQDPKSDNKDHPVCKFIGRFKWLKEKLSIDSARLAVGECETFDSIMADIKPRAATLIFPTYYMNSPASMFGHTLINIETESRSTLLNPAINYSAITTETNGLLFAVKGLFGYYKGYYSIEPYYQKIQEYSDINQRDIWEYPLSLEKDEVMRLMMHLWELKDVYADYYFFDENCSYNLLFLLESARPSLRLTEKFPLWALPIDTIRAVKKESLLENIIYRPSKAAKIQHKISLLSKAHQKIALDIIHGRIEPQTFSESALEKEEKIRIIDLAVDYLQYRYAKKSIEKTDYQQILLKTLTTRSKLGQSEDSYQVSLPPRPDDSHETARFSIGGGVKDGKAFGEISIRPVFCDMTDSDYSPTHGTQIQFANTRLRYYSEDQKIVLENLDLIDIMSVSPRDDYFKPYSWKVNTGFFRKTMNEDEETSLYRLNTGGGMAVFSDLLGLSYAFAETEMNLGGKLENSYALGAGFSAGILKRIRDKQSLHLWAKQLFFLIGDDHQVTEASFSYYFKLSRSMSLGADIVWRKAFEYHQTDAAIRWHFFF